MTSHRRVGRICSIPGCGRPHSARGYCATHNNRVEANNGDPLAHIPIKVSNTDQGCSVADCNCRHYCKGFCIAHYGRYQRYEILALMFRLKNIEKEAKEENVNMIGAILRHMQIIFASCIFYASKKVWMQKHPSPLYRNCRMQNLLVVLNSMDITKLLSDTTRWPIGHNEGMTRLSLRIGLS